MSSEAPESAPATVAKLDPTDRRILVELQESADMSMQELGERVGLSHTPCWRRVRRLEREGFITRRVALLDAKQLGLAVDVFVNVNLRRHQENALNRFEEAVQDVPEIVECYTVSGETDFLLRVVVSDVGAYERLLKATLVHLPEVGNLTSTFALRQVKYTTALPLSRVGDGPRSLRRGNGALAPLTGAES